MGQEYELKFSATQAQQDAIHAAFGPWEAYEMETTYYDTPSRALSDRHITLRRRMENSISICTVKTPQADGARGEWDCECATIEEALPRLCESGAPAYVAQLAQEGLTAVCGARFTRLACALTLDGTTAELALDRGLLLGGKKQTALCEVEVELKDGSREAVTDLAIALAAQHGLVPEQKSKFRRAMALAEGE